MAKLVLEVDTDAGTLSCTVNGKAVDNVNTVRAYTGATMMYSDDDSNSPTSYAGFSVETSTKEDGVVTLQCVTASKEEKDKKVYDSIRKMLRRD